MVANSSDIISPASEKAVNGSLASSKVLPPPEKNGQVNGYPETQVAELNVSGKYFVLSARYINVYFDTKAC